MPSYVISIDWGTSRLRIRLVDATSGDVLAAVATDDGVASLACIAGDSAMARAERFAVHARRSIAALKTTHGADSRVDDAPVVISGMAGSSLGWCELPYARLPFPLDGLVLVTRDMGPLGGGHRGHVILISGVRSDDDVMRGEEVEAIGLAEADALPLNTPLTLVLPGTHSKHLFIHGGTVTSFRTFLTGELFEVLRRHSVLRHSTTPNQPAAGQFEDFAAGVLRGADRHSALSAALFRVRTRQVLDGTSAASNTEFLSGLLIGNELAALDPAIPVLIAARQPIVGRYRSAAEVLGLSLLEGPDDSTMDRALTLAHRRIAHNQRMF